MSEDGGPLLHFSEDPSITRFVPHVPPTNPTQSPGVWAIDEEHAPVYWFPRDCPRGAVWATTEAEHEVLRSAFLTTARRVHAAELGWLERIRRVALYVYALDRGPFERWPDAEGQWIARTTVEPISVRPLGDLLAQHAEAGIELRLMPELGLFWSAVTRSGLPFSGIRLRNARGGMPVGP